MKKTLEDSFVLRLEGERDLFRHAFAKQYPGESIGRQPVHVFYGGANLFRAGVVRRLGDLALRSLDEYAPDAATFFNAVGVTAAQDLQETVYTRVRAKLQREPIEDLRIDFEDGYGLRPEAEEDGHAASAARELAAAAHADQLPPSIGIRIKPLNSKAMRRGVCTLDIFLTELLEHTRGKLPKNFCVTLPKVVSPQEVEALVKISSTLENKLGLPESSLKIELMIESTQALFNPDGRVNLLPLVNAADGRCVAVHFGPHDYAASRNLMSSSPLTHFAADFAREVMQVALRSTGVRLVDGPTNILPVPTHHPSASGELSVQHKNENRDAVHQAWRLHFNHISRAMENGFYQSWDLHPAQLPVRYAAVYMGFLRGREQASKRLRNFFDEATHATRIGQHFDDFAMAQGLVNYFLSALNCGALVEDELKQATGMSPSELRLFASSVI